MQPGRLALVLSFAIVTTATAAQRLIPIAQSSSLIAPKSSDPYDFQAAGPYVFFSAADGAHGIELWRTDGTPEGTVLFDLVPGPDHSVPIMGGTLGNAVFMTARGTGGVAIWRSDGTIAGTWKVGTTSPDPLGNLGLARLFTADTRLFVAAHSASVTDPPDLLVTADGTARSLKNIGTIPLRYDAQAIGAGGKLYFIGRDPNFGSQLWVSDGTTAGTQILRQFANCVAAASCGSFELPFLFRAGNGACFATEEGIYRTDGTPEGTVRLIGLQKWSSIKSAQGRGVSYLFTDQDAIRTDGTVAGTWRFEPIKNVLSSRVLGDDRVAVMRGTDGDYELRVTDGTPERTRAELVPKYSSLIGAAGSRLFLQAASPASGYELWTSDADQGGAALLKDLDPRFASYGPQGSNPGAGAMLGSKFIFPATTEAGRELWISDGTPEGTNLLLNIAPDVPGGAISGTVRDAATGAPVPGAKITLCNQKQCDDVVSTNGAGFYRFTGVAAGVYTLRADNRAYLIQIYDGMNCPCPMPELGAAVDVKVGFETAGVDFSLIKGGTISGHVWRAATGEPIDFARMVVRGAAGEIVDEIARTDPDGGYRSRGLPTGDYYVESHPSSNPRPAADQIYRGRNCPPEGCDRQLADAVHVTTGRDTPDIDFSLHEYGTIAGTLFDASSGLPAAGVEVAFRKGTALPAIRTSDAAGRYQSPPLAEGSYHVIVLPRRGYRQMIYPNALCPDAGCDLAAGTAVTLSVDEAVTGIDLRLQQARGRLAGILTDAAGRPVQGVRPYLTSTKASWSPDFPTDAAGRYEIWGMPAGTYYFVAGNELYSGVECSASCPVTGATPIEIVDRQTTTRDIRLQSRQTNFSGRVLDAKTGQPVSKPYVQLHDVNGSYLVRAMGDENGRYAVSFLSLRHSYYVVALATGYPSMAYPRTPVVDCVAARDCSLPSDARSIPAGVSNDVDFALVPFGVISGRVTDATSGIPLPAVDVRFNSSDALNLGSARTQSDGTYRWDRAIGPVHVYVNNILGAPYNGQVYPDLDCGAGTCDPRGGKLVDASNGATITGIDLRLQPNPQGFGKIRGRVVDAATGTPLPNVPVTAKSLGSFSTHTDAEGYYVLPAEPALRLPDGEYYLEAGTPPFLAVETGERALVSISSLREPSSPTLDLHLTTMQVNSIAPAFGTPAGGTQITIDGTGFSPRAAVMIGYYAAKIVSATPERIVALTPWSDSAGKKEVRITLPSPSSFSMTLRQPFTYIVAPVAMRSVAGTPQTAAINTEFAEPLQVRLTDAWHTPLSGVSVTFAAPAAGASGTFAGNSTVFTNANGLAAAPPFMANGTTGSYAVTATAGSLTATFALTNVISPAKRRAAGR